MTIIRPYHNI